MNKLYFKLFLNDVIEITEYKFTFELT